MLSSRPAFFYGLCILTLFITGMSLLEGCANIIPPLGGPKDSLPPRVVTMDPVDSTLGFTGKRIVFNFDEYVQLDQVQENLLVSPTPKINPVIESKLKTVTVRIKDTLQPNTTYVIDFGNAVRDVNEGNPLKNFRYIFSTGKYLDSLELTGKVIVAETGKVDTTLIVLLHTNLTDSAVAKEKPKYYTRVDKDGNYRFRNLAPGTYALYALKDEGASRRYMSPAQLFAFYSEPVDLKKSQGPLNLYAYSEPEEAKKPKTTAKPSKSAAPPAAKGKKKNDEEKQDRRLRFSNSLDNGQQDIQKPLVLTFPDPLKEFDSTKLVLADEKFKPVTYQLEKDSTNKILTIQYNWPLDQEFHLITEKDMASDSLGKSILHTDTLTFRTMKESDYGSIKFRFTNLDTSRKPVLQLIQNDKVLYHFPVTGKELIIKRFRPAEFELRMLYDENGNGVWDKGSFFGTKKQPEKVEAIGKQLNVKANWDNEVDITL
jgi:uncharacterized protein (DUF2141 family)